MVGLLVPPDQIAAGTVRDRLLALVHSDPGISKSELCRSLGIAWGTASYHVQILERAGLLELQRVGRAKALFPADLGEQFRVALVCKRAREGQLVLETLRRVPQATQRDLAVWLGVSRKVVRRAIQSLLDAGLIADLSTGLVSGRPRYVLAQRLQPSLGVAPSAPFRLHLEQASAPGARSP